MADELFEAKKAFLFSYLDELRKEARLRDEWEQIRTRLTKVSPDLSGMPRGGPGHDLADGIQALMDAENKLGEQIIQSMKAREAVYNAIQAVPVARQRNVLGLRFVNGWNLEKIANLYNYSVPMIKKISKDGIMAVEIPNGKKIIPNYTSESDII